MTQPLPLPPPLPADVLALTFRLERVEHDVKQLETQLTSYALVTETTLKLEHIQETVRRIETDVGKAKEQLQDLNKKLTDAEKDVQDRDAKQREAAANIQIWLMRSIIGAIVVLFTGLLIAYANHAIH